jgi:PAS domain S-box-containing protein
MNTGFYIGINMSLRISYQRSRVTKNDHYTCTPKRLFLRLSLILLTVLLCQISSAMAENQIVRVGVYENAPKIFTSDSGQPSGIFVDIIEYVAEREGWKLHYVPGTWGEGLDRLQRGEIDLMPDVVHTADREKIFDFHGVPVLSSWFQVYARKHSGIRSLLDLAGKRIVVLERSVQQDAFVRLNESFGFKTTVISVPDYQRIFELVENKEVDAAVTNRFYGQMHAGKFNLEETAVIFHPSNLFFAGHKNTSRKLLDIIDKHLSDLKNDSQSVYYASLRRWISEEVRFKFPLWLQTSALVALIILLISLAGSVVLKRQVNARTSELHTLNRVLRTLSECNQTLVRSTDEGGLLQSVCRILLDIGGYGLAWIGFVVTDAEKTIRPVAQAGFEAGDLEIVNTIWARIEPIYNLTNNVFRTGRPSSIRHIPTEPDFEPWRNEMRELGCASVFALPLIDEGRPFGVLVICSVRADAFDTQEAAHLTDLASDLTFGIVGHRTRVALQQAEARRREAKKLFENIVEFLPDATFVVDRDKKVIAWNQACETLTGVKKDTLIGRGNYAYAVPFFGERRPILLDLLDMPMPAVEAKYKYVRRQGDRLFAESFIPDLRDGHGAHLWGVASPLYDQDGHRCGAIETVRDVSEQKGIEESLLASERKYRELVMHANSIIMRWSSDGKITFLNEFGQRFFGYKEAEILGRHVVGTIVPEDESTGRRLRPLMERILANPKKYERNVNENIRRYGERVWIDWTNKMVLDEQGRIKEILSIGSDITDRKQAEEQIRRLNEDLRRHAEVLEKRVADRTAELVEAKERAESADRLKSAFLATMSHELRTPLNSIIGFTGIMLQELAGPLNDEQKKQLGMVQSSSRHLLSLINDVLDISKIEAGQLSLSVSSFDLGPSIEKMTTVVRPWAEKKGLDIVLDIADDVKSVISDQRRLEQVILNLLNNAVKFTEKGHVAISCRRDGDYYFLSVSDTGTGMRSEELPGLFQPFHQIDTGLTRKHEGTGLGLSICKKLLNLMSGTIDVESEWGKGSIFTIRIPQALHEGHTS